MNKHPARPADFIIVGAMKCGTTSLHHLLGAHPRIHIPDGEIGYYDHDEYFEHLDFFTDAAGRWIAHDYEAAGERGRDWYSRHFAGAQPGQLLGEDSTTYLSSRHAAARIARINAQTRIIVMLREPAARAYSQYWHMLRSGRVMHTFEDTLRLMPERILARSFYCEQVQRYLDHFPSEQLHFILFEEFVRSPRTAAVAALRFLGIEDPGYQPPVDSVHRNAAQLPRSRWLQRLRNHWLWRSEFGRYAGFLKGLSPVTMQSRPAPAARLLRRLFSRLNPVTAQKAPPMREDTRQFLTTLLRRENAGLAEMIGRDVEAVWYPKG